MSRAEIPSPLLFEPVFLERIWGGRKLESFYGKAILPGKRIGESWEIADRPEHQTLVRGGPWHGRSLHDLWANERSAVFGSAPDSPRFPLLIKLLDCRERLSLQVHPAPEAAHVLGGETKSECWYIADAEPEAELYLGWRKPSSEAECREALARGTAEQLIHHIFVNTGHVFFIPSGRIHAIGAGNLIVEVQQNSDTTFRVFDWNRVDENGASRLLHLDQAMRCIRFDDCTPQAVTSKGESLLRTDLFALERWQLDKNPRELSLPGSFGIAFCLSGVVACGSHDFRAGEFFLVPAEAKERMVKSQTETASLLRIAIPNAADDPSHK